MLRGEIPREIIYEDDLCFVIPTIEPLTPGHLLIIPNEQIDVLWDIDDPLYQHLLSVAKTIARTLKKSYDYIRINMIVEGFEVPHAHIHLFGVNQGLVATFKQLPGPGPAAISVDELKQTADKVRANL